MLTALPGLFAALRPRLCFSSDTRSTPSLPSWWRGRPWRGGTVPECPLATRGPAPSSCPSGPTGHRRHTDVRERLTKGHIEGCWGMQVTVVDPPQGWSWHSVSAAGPGGTTGRSRCQSRGSHREGRLWLGDGVHGDLAGCIRGTKTCSPPPLSPRSPARAPLRSDPRRRQRTRKPTAAAVRVLSPVGRKRAGWGRGRGTRDPQADLPSPLLRELHELHLQVEIRCCCPGHPEGHREGHRQSARHSGPQAAPSPSWARAKGRTVNFPGVEQRGGEAAAASVLLLKCMSSAQSPEH